jgi:hypothetical protein
MNIARNYHLSYFNSYIAKEAYPVLNGANPGKDKDTLLFNSLSFLAAQQIYSRLHNV